VSANTRSNTHSIHTMLNLNYQSLQAADEHHSELNLHAIVVSGTSVLPV